MNNLKRNIDVENKDESTTIINEDNFEIINNSKFEDEINENNKEKSRTKTSSSLEKSNKIFIKDAKGEEQLRFEFMKEYTKKGTNNDNNFLRRMHNDIDKRKNMEKIMDKFIEQTKFKIKEPEKIKVFNRLIEDTNRRYESKEKILKYQEREEPEFELEDIKKYNQKQWDEIYKNRFNTFLKNINSKKLKGISDILQKELDDKTKKEKSKKLYRKKYKNKSEVKKIIENNTNNLYNDFLLRQQRKINHENNKKLLMNQENKLTMIDKLKKDKKYIQSTDTLKNKDINLKTNKSINRKINCFTPKALKSKNIFLLSNEIDEMKKINNNLNGEKISEILINIFFKKNGI